jgi:hypothetical protein
MRVRSALATSIRDGSARRARTMHRRGEHPGAPAVAVTRDDHDHDHDRDQSRCRSATGAGAAAAALPRIEPMLCLGLPTSP